jgi:LacI family transcriptional regulator
LTTIKDVARRANVSIGTVSAVLNRSKFVSPVLLQRVQEAVHELGYRTDGIARSLKRGKTDLIGLIVDDLNNLFYVELLEQIEREAHARGYAVLLCQSGGDIAIETAYLDVLRKYRVDGLIWSVAGRPENYRADLAGGLPGPLVFVDRVCSTFEQFDSVVLDNVAAGRQATDYLLDMGHRDIILLNGPEFLAVAAERRDGFLRALKARHVSIDETLIKNCSFREQEAFEACHAVLAKQTRATAILATSGGLFVAAMRAMKALHLACPDDISIVGVDDFPLATLFTPSVTVVAQPVKTMGKIAVELLMRRLKLDGGPPVHRVLEPTLIVRGSCRAIVGKS